VLYYSAVTFQLLESRPDNPHSEARETPTLTILLPIASKVFEKLLLKRLLPLVEHANLIPNNQFGFRPKHSTIEQTHRFIRVLNDALDNSQYCSAAFLDISQAFDKFWHTGLLYKLRRSLPLNYFLILNSYLSYHHVVVRVNTELTGLTPVNAGVPQGSVLGPILYLLYTADLPTSPDSFTAIFADDIAVVATDSDPATVSPKTANHPPCYSIRAKRLAN
jgi:hypothetical protein